MNNKYQMPRSRREKIELLSSIAAGRKTINELMEKTFVVYISMGDGNYKNSFGQILTREEMGKCDYELTLTI